MLLIRLRHQGMPAVYIEFFIDILQVGCMSNLTDTSKVTVSYSFTIFSVSSVANALNMHSTAHPDTGPIISILSIRSRVNRYGSHINRSPL